MGIILQSCVCSNCVGKIVVLSYYDLWGRKFVKQGCHNWYHCICIKYKTVLYLVDTENEFSIVFSFEAFVMKVQFKLVIQNVTQICWLDLKRRWILSLCIVKYFEIIFALFEMQFIYFRGWAIQGWSSWPWRWRCRGLFKYEDIFPQWHKLASQLTDS